ncbi:MAG: NADH:flavin oxidoreductase/NADH oxidase family protein [Arenicella sp.]|nr:NADH:flavin oxidoreductase/NADH oxidase family protein [Arenicella sp.]
MSDSINSLGLFSPLTLPNGVVLKNRLCKAAMEENLCEWAQYPGEKLQKLYTQWADGGAGLILTGNVMISADALTGPGGVVLEQGRDLAPFKEWAAAAKSADNQVWMQISHPGRQVYAAMGEQAVSASDKGVDIPGFSKLFAKPRTLDEKEITALVSRFADTAELAQEAGFDGCQIHAAHGYLISQFLSPLTNTRDDQYGGSRENRARFLFEAVAAIRAQVAKEFCVSVKLNSADFQKSGFDLEDAAWVVSQLNDMGIDLIELSGGSYESPAMQGNAKDESLSSTLKREAYFIDFARDIAQVASVPIMVTGGIRTKQVAQAALEKDEQGIGVSVLGLARAFAYEPALASSWQSGASTQVIIPNVEWKNKTISALANMAVTKLQLGRMAKGLKPKPTVNPVIAIVRDRLLTRYRTKRYQRWRKEANN